jgi:hypothetical protein
VAGQDLPPCRDFCIEFGFKRPDVLKPLDDLVDPPKWNHDNSVLICHDHISAADTLSCNLSCHADLPWSRCERRCGVEAAAPDRQSDFDNASVISDRSVSDERGSTGVAQHPDHAVTCCRTALITVNGSNQNVAGFNEIQRSDGCQNIGRPVDRCQRGASSNACNVAPFTDWAD